MRTLTMPARCQSAFALRLLPLLLWLAQFALVPRAAAQNNPRFTHIAAGANHSLALKADGTVGAWGSAFLCMDCPSGGWNRVPEGLEGVVAIAAGPTHNLALKADGAVVGWGKVPSRHRPG